MRELARRHGMVIVAPFYEQAGAARYNSAAVVDADGRFLGVYRKHHVPSPHAGNYEPFYFHRPDVGFPVFDTAYGRIGDLHLLRPALPGDRSHLRGQGRRDRLQSLGDRAAPVGAGVGARAAGARAGQRLLRRRPEPGRAGPAVRQREYFGKSYFCSPLGEIVAQAGRGVEEVLIADLDLDEIPSSRESWHTNRLYLDRRPATYHEMLARGHPDPRGTERRVTPWLTGSEASTTFRS